MPDPLPDPAGAVVVGVDVGGTFTDAVVVTGGRVVTAKVPSTPADQSVGVIASVALALTRAGLIPGQVTNFAHGMTVGTNALLEGTGAPIALITTEGFGDILEIRRQDRAHLYRLDAHHPPPLVPRDRRFEVRERCGPEGVLIPMDQDSVDAAVEAVRAADVPAVAVGLLFSFLYPEHERHLRDALHAALPAVHVSASCEVLPEIREYERISTTCVDAHLAPVLGGYLAALGARARAEGLPVPAIMQSNGGLIDIEDASRHAAWTVLSGPAAGVIGAAHIARLCGIPDVLTFDMGGTSCDVALVEGEPARTTHATINGHPLHLPMLDVHTVSAGGGSIAWVDDGGALRVGPGSAGAEPGPACYGRGGTEATVTDANVVLGRIAATHPLAGDLTIEPDRALTAVTRVAEQLGVAPAECAEGIIAVAVQEMARALRVVSVERGVDPRHMALVAFGGAGPLHACDVADALGMRTIILPAAAGLLAALGLVVAGERRDEVLSVLARLDAACDLSEPLALVDSRAAALVPNGVRSHTIDCRYVGQTHTITVPWQTERPLTEVVERFHDAHRRRYGDADPSRAVEAVSIRAAATRAGIAPDLGAPTSRSLPHGAPAGFSLDGATGWLASGWNARLSNVAIILERS